jgi:regulator of protease activity HflC (stomatin/prohibitin superfamily)
VELPAYLTQHTQAYLEPHHLGVIIQGASVAHLLPPSEVKREFDAVTSAQTQIRTLENVARQDAATRLRQADAERYQLERQSAAYVHEQISQAKAEAEAFTRRLKQYLHLRQVNPNFLATIWWEEIGKLFTQMKANGRIDLLDNHLGGDGLDITIAPALPKKK